MVGIVILNYNSTDDTIKCICSIKEHTTVLYKIYIVDGCPQDNSFAYLSDYFREFKNVEVIKSNMNGGYSYGNNLGAFKAIEDGANFVLIINPDVVLKNKAIDIMHTALINEPELAIVGPRIFDNKDTDMQFASKLYTLKGFLCSKKPLAFIVNKRFRENRYYHFNFDEDYTFQGMVSGCCFMIKTNDFKSIGGFDTNIFLYYEEDIIAYKLFRINKRTKILSRAIVVHNHSNSVKKEGEAFIRFHRFYSSQYVLKKYTGINNTQFLFVSLLHIIPFTIKAISDKSYRKIYINFLKKIASLYS